jgi:hypothetical protein
MLCHLLAYYSRGDASIRNWTYSNYFELDIDRGPWMNACIRNFTNEFSSSLSISSIHLVGHCHHTYMFVGQSLIEWLASSPPLDDNGCCNAVHPETSLASDLDVVGSLVALQASMGSINLPAMQPSLADHG